MTGTMSEMAESKRRTRRREEGKQKLTKNQAPTGEMQLEKMLEMGPDSTAYGVCVRADAGCPEGGRHRSRPVGPGQVVSLGHPNTQESAGVAFRERTWSSVSPRT